MYIANELNTPGIWSYFYDFRIMKMKLSGGREQLRGKQTEGKAGAPCRGST